jgi:hypothetical protein
MHGKPVISPLISSFLFLSAFTLSFFSLALQLTLAVAFAFGLPLGLAAFLLDRGFLFFGGEVPVGHCPKHHQINLLRCLNPGRQRLQHIFSSQRKKIRKNM